MSGREKLCERERLPDWKTINLVDAVRSQESLSFHVPIPNRGRCSACCFSEPQFSGRRGILGTHVSYLFRVQEIVSGLWSKTPQADAASFSPPLPKVNTCYEEAKSTTFRKKSSHIANCSPAMNSSGLWACSIEPGPQTIVGIPSSLEKYPASVP